MSIIVTGNGVFMRYPLEKTDGHRNFLRRWNSINYKLPIFCMYFPECYIF